MALANVCYCCIIHTSAAVLATTHRCYAITNKGGGNLLVNMENMDRTDEENLRKAGRHREVKRNILLQIKRQKCKETKYSENMQCL